MSWLMRILVAGGVFLVLLSAEPSADLCQLSPQAGASAFMQNSYDTPSVLNVRHVHGQFNFMVTSHAVTIRIDAHSFSFDPLDNRCNRKPITIPVENILELQVMFEPFQGPNQIELGRGYRFYNKGAWLAFPDASALNQVFQSYGTKVFGLYVKALKPGSPKDTVDFTFTDSDTNIPTPGVYPGAPGSWPYGTGIGGRNYEIVREIAQEFQRRIEQNVVAKRESERREAAQLEAERRAAPADLKTSVQFDDSASILKTGRVDAGKKAELVVTLENQGQGPAYEVILAVSADNPLVTFLATQQVGEIAPGQRQQIRVPIEASLNIPSGELNVFVEAKEKRGYDARKVKLVIPMARLEKPLLSVANILINDGTTGLARGNGNKIPEGGETVELIVFVKNAGTGPAAAELSLVSADSGIEVLQRSASLGLIQPDRIEQGRLVLSIPRTYSGKAMTLNIRVVDGRGEMVASVSQHVTFNVTSRMPTLAATARITSLGAELQELTNDQTVELEVTPENAGSLDAIEVAVRVSAADAVLQEAQAPVGLLRAGEKGASARFALTIPRAFIKERLPIRIELSQKDFPGWTTTLDVPVKPRQPLLNYKFSVVGRVGGATIEQNETAVLEVQIFNNGGLAAREVQVAISVTTSGVEIQGEKMTRIGVIAPNSQASARFKIHALRSIPAGALPVQLNILQSDFSSVTDTIGLNVREELPDVTRAEMPVAPATLPSRHKPVILLAEPREGDFVREKTVKLIGAVADEKGISRLDITVNGKPVPEDVIQQGLKRRVSGNSSARDQVDFTVPISLDPGSNEIRIIAFNVENESDLQSFKATRLEDRAGGPSSPPALAPLSDVDQHILSLEGVRPNQRRWAVIIGIEQYRKVAPVAFASRDAYAMREYAIKVLGVPSEQIFLLVDDQATKAEMLLLLEERLQQKAQAGDTIYVYFAGHGVPEVKDGTPYLLPSDGDPQSPRITGFSLEDFYAALGKLQAERVIVFLDTCFSGLRARGDNQESLLTNTRPGVIRVKNPVLRYPNLISFAAAGNDQLSNAYKKEAHGLFTYFLLKGLSGAAQKSPDRLLLSELEKYVTDYVTQKSRQFFGANQYQTPVGMPVVDASRDSVLKEK